MPRVPLCSSSKHVWRAIRGDKFERCEVCGTFFPCKGKRCGHGDCESAREIGITAWYLEWEPVKNDSQRQDDQRGDEDG